MPTEPTRLTNAQRQHAWRVLDEIPYRLQIPGAGAGTIVTVESLLNYLGRALPHIAKEVTAFEARAQENARAATVLRGLRSSVENVASTLEEIDARPELDAIVAEAEATGGWHYGVESRGRVPRREPACGREGKVLFASNRAGVTCRDCKAPLERGDALVREIVARKPE